MSIVTCDDFWDGPINVRAIAHVISSWTASYVARQKEVLNFQKQDNKDFYASLYAREYPQRYMEFALAEKGTLSNWKMTRGICGCEGNSASSGLSARELHADITCRIAEAYACIGRPWQRLPCALHVAGIKEIPEQKEITKSHVLHLLAETFDSESAIMTHMDWGNDGASEQNSVAAQNATWDRVMIARARGLLYGRVMLDFRLPEVIGYRKFIFPYHEFDQIFESKLSYNEIADYIFTLCGIASQRVQASRESMSTLAERIYRAYPESPKRTFVLGMLAQFPELAGVNLESASAILKALRDSNPPHGFVDLDGYEKQAIRIVRVFGRNWERWLNRFSRETSRMYEGIHDASMPLPDIDLNKQKLLGKYLLQHISTDITRLTMIARNWETVESNHQELPPLELVKLCVKNFFPHDTVDVDFAVECSAWNLDDSYWPDLYTRWKAAQEVPLPAWSQIKVKFGGYTGRFLERTDPRSVWIGEYTNCCQNPKNIARDCAYHSMESPYGACFVVENTRGEIVAASWTWEGTQGVCFDSLEAKGVGNRKESVQQVYIATRNAIMTLGLPWLRRVTVGSAYGKVFDINTLRRAQKLIHRKNNYQGEYTDASTQFSFPDAPE